MVGELRAAGVLQEDISSRLKEMLEDRNWLVHRARRETRGALSDEVRFASLIKRIGEISDEALALIRQLGKDVQEYILRSGVPREVLDREAERLAREWRFQ